MQLQLYYPVKPLFVNQKFGEIANLAYYKANGINFVGHNGIDFMAKHGQPIYASHDGVAYYEIDGSQGHGVVLRTNELFDYANSDGSVSQVYFKSIYWHMIDSSKEPQFRSPVEGHDAISGGLPIKAGDLLGYADTTGLSTGDHLHYGLKPCLPGEPVGTWYNVLQDNGYMGAIDPQPYFNGLFAEDISPVNHVFNKSIYIGDSGPEVLALQIKLKKLGLFTVAPTGNYGPITKAAVYAFQQKYVAVDAWSRLQVWFNKGDAVLSLTRAALNSLS